MKEAQERAEKNSWIEAANLCRRALSQIESLEGEFNIISLAEFSSECYFKAAFQAQDRKTFKELMTESRNASEKARALYDPSHQTALALTAQIRIKTAEFWIQDDPRDRIILARSIVDLSKEIARLLDETGRPDEAFQRGLELLTFFKEFINLTTEFKTLEDIFDQATALGRTLLEKSRTQPDNNDNVKILSSMVWYLAVEAQVVLPPSDFQGLGKEAQIFESELQETSRKVGTPIAVCLAKESAGHVNFNIRGDPALALQNYEESLEETIRLSDSLQAGRLQWLCAQTALWLAVSENDPDEKLILLKNGEKFARDSIYSTQISFQTTELSAAHTSLGRCLAEQANLAGTDAEQRRKLLNEALQAASQAVSLESGTWAWSRAASAQANVLHHLSKMETHERKLKLLQQVLDTREQLVGVNDNLFPHFWNNVIAPYNAALVRSELADFQNGIESKKSLLNRAISEMESCLQRGRNWGTNPGFVYRLAQHSEAYGDILAKLHSLAADVSIAQKSIRAFEKAIEGFRSLKSTANVAAVEWKIARLQNDLHLYQHAAEKFKSAAADYRKAGVEIPGSRPLFEDLARYLDAWSIIESARLHHDDGEYLSAAEYYATASKQLKESGEWSYLSPLFLGRSFLEKGEGQSAEENHLRATESFRAAVDQFQNEAEMLEKKLQETQSERERRELESWLEITKQRENYCHARLELEEARSLDKKGDKTASASKFRGSSESLTSLSTRASDDQERVELEGLARFCEGWAQMKEAEAQASPEKYSEAAESFLKLRSTQTKEPLLYLALANAAICKALGAGTMFHQTRDVQYYSEVKKHTEAAADYFKQAGFRKTEAWTRATQRLYDSLIFITDAESERDPTKKTELYHLAENHLRIAARLYGEAGFPTRKEEATNQLQRIREEKRVLLAPLEALSQIPTATASSLSLLPRGRGQPIGTQRFDEAYVVGDMSTAQREIPLGNTFVLDLEIVNVGKTPATLVNLQNMLPDGFELVSVHNSEVSPEGELDLKGKNLEHLKTHAVKIPLRAIRNGTSELRPRLFYVDDSGTIKTYQFRPTTVTVLDVGPPSSPIALVAQAIPSTPSLGEEFRFDTERSRQVFQSLVREFLVDYMSKRLYVEKAGWRTLVQIVRETKIPRSALYGPRGKDGPVLAELERRGLIESRIFPKERGRGGSVKRVRVAYDNAIVKKIVERSVLGNK